MSWFGDVFKGISQAVPIVGPIIGGLFGNKQTKDTNETNIDLSNQQQAFEERMSNTAYQRARTDMEKAGLNPILTAKLGGASTPLPSLPQVENPAQYTMGAASASSAKLLEQQSIKAQIATQQSQQKVNSAQAISIAQDARQKMMQNDALEQKYKLQRYEDALRNRRPNWLKSVGTSFKDTSDTLLRPITGLFNMVK